MELKTLKLVKYATILDRNSETTTNKSVLHFFCLTQANKLILFTSNENKKDLFWNFMIKIEFKNK